MHRPDYMLYVTRVEYVLSINANIEENPQICQRVTGRNVAIAYMYTATIVGPNEKHVRFCGASIIEKLIQSFFLQQFKAG